MVAQTHITTQESWQVLAEMLMAARTGVARELGSLRQFTMDYGARNPMALDLAARCGMAQRMLAEVEAQIVAADVPAGFIEGYIARFCEGQADAATSLEARADAEQMALNWAVGCARSLDNQTILDVWTARNAALLALDELRAICA